MVLAAGSRLGPYEILAPDGERFLVVRRTADDVPEDAAVVLNWTTHLSAEKSPERFVPSVERIASRRP